MADQQPANENDHDRIEGLHLDIALPIDKAAIDVDRLLSTGHNQRADHEFPPRT